MADKTDSMQYKPEELAEIERITRKIPGSDSYQEGAASFASGPSSFPEDLTMPASDDDIMQSEDDDFSSGMSFDEPLDSAAPDDDVEDITGMIQELPEEEESAAFGADELSIADEESLPEETSFEPEAGDGFDFPEPPAAEEPSADFDFGSLPEEPQEDESSFGAPKYPAEETPPSGEITTRQALDRLTASEPPAVDAQDVASDIYNPADFDEPEETAAAEDTEFPAFEDIPDLQNAGMPAEELPFSSAPAVSLEGGSLLDVPDLSDLSMGDAGDMAEAGISDIPDIGMDSLGSFGETSGFDEPSSPSTLPPVESGLSAFDEMETFDTEPEGPEIPKELADEIPDIPSMNIIDDVLASEPVPDIPDLQEPSGSAFGSFEDDEGSSFGASPAAPKSGLDLSEAELRRLKNAMLLFPPELLRAVKDVILNDMLPEDDTRILVDMILNNRDDADVQQFLEGRLHRTIAVKKGSAVRRRVISSRPEYSSSSSRERQKKLFKVTKIAGAAVVAVCVLTVLGYQLVYKPFMAKKLITEGVALILKKDDVIDAAKNYDRAEMLFRRVNAEYVHDYLPGYNRYARAYFDKKQFARSLKKLNDAYYLSPSNIDTLTNLGFFYKKVPDAVYDDDLKNKIHDMYYKKAPPSVERIRNRYDVAIDFYLKAKYVNPKNITSLVGIGDVYFLQGQYLKARQYYESILKVDADSIAGYSGLMNLYIERDDLSDLLTVFGELREKDLLGEIPSPLLGKLAGYLLSKSASGDKNIRIDYGIMSERIKDEADNTFPAVRVVLNALHKKDADYPPLYLHYAKFALKQDNLVQVKGYLEQAIEKADERGQKYFGALSMLGEYYYKVKDPSKAYAYLKEAAAASLNPADFTQEDFYAETEQIGRTYAVMGNIFYYYFDKVTSRFGDSTDEAELDEEAPDHEADKMMNYEIAMKKYEQAAAAGYQSSEVNYNLGRIFYMKGLYDKAVTQWLNLYEDFTSSPELMFALGNAFYHLNNTESAKAEYQKLINVYEHQAERVKTIVPSRKEHRVMIGSLASSYNNLGAVYLKKGSETKSTLCFWKSIEYAHKLADSSEFARLNLARVVRKKGDTRQPVLDENIPFSVDIYRADMR